MSEYRAQRMVSEGEGGRTRQGHRVNRRLFTQRRPAAPGTVGGDLPTWWPGMVALQSALRRAETAVEKAQNRRDLGIWLAIRHRGASFRWVAAKLGMTPRAIQYHIANADRLVAERGWDEAEVTRQLNLAARTRATRERLLRDEAGRRVVDAWSAPGPADKI